MAPESDVIVTSVHVALTCELNPQFRTEFLVWCWILSEEHKPQYGTESTIWDQILSMVMIRHYNGTIAQVQRLVCHLGLFPCRKLYVVFCL